jgi:hypothetical protein
LAVCFEAELATLRSGGVVRIEGGVENRRELFEVAEQHECRDVSEANKVALKFTLRSARRALIEYIITGAD